MYKTADLITSEYIRLSPISTLDEVLEAFIRYRSDIACVVDSANRLLGVVTKYIVYRMILEGSSVKTPIDSIFRTDVVTVNINDDFNQIRDKLLSANVAHAAVVNDYQELCGVISKSDLLRGLHWERDIFINRLDLVMENLPIGIVLLDNLNRISHANKCINEMLGFVNHKLVNYEFAECFPELMLHVSNVAQTKKKLVVPKIRVRNLNCVVSLIPMFEPDLEGMVIMFQELSSLENVALELKTTKGLANTIQTILEATDDYLIVTDLMGNITYFSDNLSQIVDSELLKQQTKLIYNIIPNLANKQLALLPEDYRELLQVSEKNYIVSVHKVRSDQEIYSYIFRINNKEVDEHLVLRLKTLESIVKSANNSLSEDEPPCLQQIITNNSVMKNTKQELGLIAKTNSTVLILGESGTGKELIANAVHELSGRKGNFTKINCAAIPLELLESELFGYEFGAFTGARKGGKPGKFELANKGTIFLDEIGDMPLSLQAKLLRVLEEKCFERIGGTTTLTSDVRFIAATNKNLKNLMLEGKFREDLFYRLNVIKFNVPPLRERLEDIPILINYFLQRLGTKYDKSITSVSQDAIDLLMNHQWYGNIRELINTMERAIIWCQESVLSKKHFNFIDVNTAQHTDCEDSQEKQLLIKLLQLYKGNKSKVAIHLGLSRVTLYKKLNHYNISQNNDYH
ncbi:MAG TPA: sigma 54-interacting transcriptional regulator [Candidatus Deferrimicrobium sp.]|nr:sigma 54-interacting transcriptional regulator [Candidatus Deferrimicrobium sp.]